MNTMIFLGGVGSGAFAATMLFLMIIRAVIGNKGADRRAMDEINRESVAELKRRNDIGEQQLDVLSEIARRQ